MRDGQQRDSHIYGIAGWVVEQQHFHDLVREAAIQVAAATGLSSVEVLHHHDLREELIDKMAEIDPMIYDIVSEARQYLREILELAISEKKLQGD